MKKVLFFDIDGTLIGFGKEMRESVKNALTMARKNGHRVVLCSGRARYQVYPWLFDYVDGVILSSGAYVADGSHGYGKEEIIFERFLTREEILKIKEAAEKSNSAIMFQSESEVISNKKDIDYVVDKFLKKWKNPARVKEVWQGGKVTDFAEECTQIKKAMFFHSEWNLRQWREELFGVGEVVGSSIESGPSDSGEITPAGIHKALGMEKYISQFGLKREDTIAFGDGSNDYDMIKYAGCGVAMGNASDEIKEIADYVTKSVDEDGIYHALKEFDII